MGKLGAGRVLALILAVMAMFVIAACGDDDDDSGSSGSGETGGEIKIGTTGPDNDDPVMFQTIQAVQAFQLVYGRFSPTRTSEGDAGSEIIPGLAEEVPETTTGEKTYSSQLREGLKYSDGTPVKASDFENTIKRLLALGSGWSFFTARSSRAPRSSRRRPMKGDISGIEADDATGEITIKLTEPDTKFLFALAEPYAAPTPAAKSPAKSSSSRPPASARTPST